MSTFGLIYIFTGEGKGKTSAALGTMLRSLGNGWRVGWVSFYKEEQWKLSEMQFVSLLNAEVSTRISMKLMGKGFFLKEQQHQKKLKVAKVNNAVVVDDDTPQVHRDAALRALEEVASMLESKTFDLIIVDEICNAIADELLSEQKVLEILSQREQTHLVLTGRYASQKLIEAADLVSEIKKVKHPFDQGNNAVKGLDF